MAPGRLMRLQKEIIMSRSKPRRNPAQAKDTITKIRLSGVITEEGSDNGDTDQNDPGHVRDFFVGCAFVIVLPYVGFEMADALMSR